MGHQDDDKKQRRTPDEGQDDATDSPIQAVPRHASAALITQAATEIADSVEAGTLTFKDAITLISNALASPMARLATLMPQAPADSNAAFQLTSGRLFSGLLRSHHPISDHPGDKT